MSKSDRASFVAEFVKRFPDSNKPSCSYSDITVSDVERIIDIAEELGFRLVRVCDYPPYYVELDLPQYPPVELVRACFPEAPVEPIKSSISMGNMIIIWPSGHMLAVDSSYTGIDISDGMIVEYCGFRCLVRKVNKK